jgi:hypothetical protein
VKSQEVEIRAVNSYQLVAFVIVALVLAALLLFVGFNCRLICPNLLTFA